MNLFERMRRRFTNPVEEDEVEDPELASLLARARSLPRSVEPERDLWSGIENQISDVNMTGNMLLHWLL